MGFHHIATIAAGVQQEDLPIVVLPIVVVVHGVVVLHCVNINVENGGESRSNILT